MLLKTPSDIVLKQRILNLDAAVCWRKHWHIDPFISHFGNVISAGLEVLEQYIVMAVERAHSLIQDECLQQQVQLFLAQERQHQAVHHSFNQFLLDSGYVHLCQTQFLYQQRYGQWVQSDTREDLEQLLRAVCGFEHLASTVGRFFLRLLRDQSVAVHKPTAYLFAFHAVEELEHKGVCFDCYQEIFKQSPMSSPEQRSDWSAFVKSWQDLLFQSLRYFFNIDRVCDNVRVLSDEQIHERLLGASGVISQTSDLYQYERANFHPWDIDDRELIHFWEKQFDLGVFTGV